MQSIQTGKNGHVQSVHATYLVGPKWLCITYSSNCCRAFLALGGGLSVGFSGLSAGFAIGIVGDAGVRGTAQQPRLFVGMILILIFAEVLGEQGMFMFFLFYFILISFSSVTKFAKLILLLSTNALGHAQFLSPPALQRCTGSLSHWCWQPRVEEGTWTSLHMHNTCYGLYPIGCLVLHL